MTLAELKKITSNLPNPLDAIIADENGLHLATVFECDAGILIRTDDKNHPLKYHILSLDTFEADWISGGIEFEVDGNSYQVTILVPLLGKYGRDTH